MRKKDQIAEAIKKVFPHLALSEPVFDGLEAYLAELERWNAKINLTAVKGFEAQLNKHLLDSLAGLDLASRLSRPFSGKALDLGSGAGLPGMIIALGEPNVEVHSIEAVGKKSSFQETTRLKLGLKNFSAQACRYEDWAQGRQGAYDCLVARALASMDELLRWADHFLKPGGAAWLWKGEGFEAEWALVDPALKARFDPPEPHVYELLGGLGGRIVILTKRA